MNLTLTQNLSQALADIRLEANEIVNQLPSERPVTFTRRCRELYWQFRGSSLSNTEVYAAIAEELGVTAGKVRRAIEPRKPSQRELAEAEASALRRAAMMADKALYYAEKAQSALRWANELRSQRTGPEPPPATQSKAEY